MAGDEDLEARIRAFLTLLDGSKAPGHKGKVGVSTDDLVAAVRADPETAALVAPKLALLATEDAAWGQRAIALAASYELAFDDDTLTLEVTRLLDAAGVQVHEPDVVPDPTAKPKADTRAIWVEVSPNMLDSRDIYPLVLLLDAVSDVSEERRQELRRYVGRCFLSFPVAASDARPVWHVPEVRQYVATLANALPYLPLFFDTDPQHGMFLVWFGSLADLEATTVDGGIDLEHDSVVTAVLRAVVAAELVAEILGVEPVVARAQMLANTPEEWQRQIEELARQVQDHLAHHEDDIAD